MAIIRGLLFYIILPAQAFAVDEIHLQLDALETAFFTTEKIELTYATPQSARPGLSVRANNIHSPYVDEDFGISLRCVDAGYTLPTIDCSNGILEITYPGLEVTVLRFTFQINIMDSSGDLTLRASTKWGNLNAAYSVNSDRRWQADISTEVADLAFLSPLLTSLVEAFKGQSIVAGKANLQAHLSGLGNRISDIAVDTDIAELSVEGDSVLEKVDLAVATEFKRTEAAWLFTHTARLLAGEMYILPGFSILGDRPGFYIASSTEPTVLRLAGNWFPEDKRIELQDLFYLHPDILLLQGSARLNTGQALLLSDLALRATIPDLAATYPIYIQPILLETNFSDLELSGAVDLSLTYQDSKLNKMELLIDDVYLDDAENRFSISGLNSHLILDSSPQALQSTLTWSGMSFYRLDFGPGDIVFESTGEDVKVLEWQDIAILDGGLKIKEFAVRDLAGSDFEIKIGGELTPISMQALTQALGWTIFPGQLSGEISGLRYSHNNLQLEGNITVGLFGGKIDIRQLQVADLFSSYSVLTTDIKIDRLDLEQLTDVFTFGKIEGSLSGRMDKLRLEDWHPGYFEAVFATPEDDDKPHRISQKALENLNELGGGLSGTLSKGFLRFLPAYSYGRLGIGCRLSKGICELSGVEESGENFFILTKGGLLPPWVEVKGAGRSIKWDDLIDGLKQIAEGEVAIE